MTVSAESPVLSPLDATPAVQSDLTPLPPSTPPTMDASTSTTRAFWVDVPLLHPDAMREYKDLIPEMLPDLSTDDDDEAPLEIVGETRLGTDHFYWVEHQNGVVHRHLVREFKDSNGALVDAYLQRKEAGTLEEFHPKSLRIHPKDRIDFNSTVSANKDKYGLPGPGRVKRTNLARAAKQKGIIIVSEDEDSGSQSEYDSENTDQDNLQGKGNGEKSRPATRRSARTAVSDAKTSYRDVSDSPVKMRVNPKRGATKKIDDDDDNYDEVLDESNTEDEEPKPKKAARGRLSRPAYGNIRPVADLSDDDSDDDNAPLHAHRRTCEKCQEPPAHELLAKYYKRGEKKAKRKKSSVDDDEDEEAEEDRLLALGGWVRCLKCCLSAHWKCLAISQRNEIIKAAHKKWEEADAAGFKQQERVPLDAYDTTEFICNGCIQGGICMVCLRTVIEAEALPEKVGVTKESQGHGDVLGPKSADGPLPGKELAKHTPPPDIIVSVPTPRKDEAEATVVDTSSGSLQVPSPLSDIIRSEVPQEIFFRCITCKRLAHYAHFPQPIPGEVLTLVEIAQYYQTENSWNCSDCASFVDPLDKILAWRPYPANAVESPNQSGDYTSRLPREYLVKWVGKSYRRLTWVPHMWLRATNGAKLKNFLATGPKVRLLDALVEDLVGDGKTRLAASDSNIEPPPSFLIVDENSRESSTQPVSMNESEPAPALPDAERRIPPAWKTVDRVLDIRLWDPAGRKRLLQNKQAKPRRGKQKRKVIDSDLDNDSEDENKFDAEAELERIAAREQGEEPSKVFLETQEEWEARTGNSLGVEHAELVIWAFVKWNDLAYEEATWDSPPGPTDVGWPAFVQAFQRLLHSQSVFVPIKNKNKSKEFDARPKALFENKRLALKTDPDLGQDVTFKLMDFQLIGLNWLFRNWWRHQPSILADDMGLGKTVQIACTVGHLIENYEAFPVLVVVPNSTVTNWLREFERWAPRLRVVPFHGDSKSRDIIREYELYHDSVGKDYTKLKFHVLVTTYDTLLGKDFGSVFKPVPRWEVLVVDEGQRLKNDSSLLFKKLNELKTIHRILLTGTPLNNNIRELFNLMNFLDPIGWSGLDDLEKKYETLTEELLNELHEALKPYFLRRTKADVLKLPPKNEVIVPVSMTAIQKEVYRSILSQNVDILKTLAQPSSRVNNTIKRSNMNNVLMQLRKCLQHPYLVSRDLEPMGPDLTPAAVHQNLLGASAKLRLLHLMLPKLKARGHRVLLFSQFTMALDIIEDFIVGEGHKFLRLDGDTKQAQRQKDMDVFNRPDSDVFIYLLSTRAGGVGVNLWSADTVIIFDPDFNPHQDLQAISRSHRYGQTKPVLVFKLMVKGAAEERIVQAGKKKLALDHLIVQKMDDDGALDDMQSILTFGAKAIFEDSESHEINYTDVDIDNLIARTEKEGDDLPEAAKSQPSFGFAKLWVVEKDAMEEIPEDAPADTEDHGFWGGVLARAAEEKAKATAAEVTGRGAKRRAAVSQTYKYDDGSPVKPNPKKRRKSNGDSDIEYNVSDADSSKQNSKKRRKGTGDSDIEYHVSDGDSSNGVGRSSVSAGDGALLTDDELLANGSRQAAVLPSTSASKLEKNGRKRKSALNMMENGPRNIEFDDSNEELHCGLCQTTHGPGLCFMTQNPSNLVDYRRMVILESPEPMDLRLTAVLAIDRHLASRGVSHLINNQPVSVPGKVVEVAPRKKERKTTHKRSYKHISSLHTSSSPKKAKMRKNMKCDICGGPFHLVKLCPIVKQGKESIKQAISRLEHEPQKATTVNILRSLCPK